MSVFGENIVLQAWNKDSFFTPKSKRLPERKIEQDLIFFIIARFSIYSLIPFFQNSHIPKILHSNFTIIPSPPHLPLTRAATRYK